MIDWERVEMLRRDIGEEDFGEVVKLFIEEAEAVVGRLQAQGTAREREADLHFLKGSALNLGFDELAAICGVEERRAAQGVAVDTAPVIGLYAASRRAFLDRLGSLAA